MSDWTSEYARMVEDCQNRQEKLTEWEVTFIDSVASQMARGKPPSPKQVETIDKIWERVT